MSQTDDPLPLELLAGLALFIIFAAFVPLTASASAPRQLVSPLSPIEVSVNNAEPYLHIEAEMSITPEPTPWPLLPTSGASASHKMVWEVSWDGYWHRCGECRSYPQSHNFVPPWEWYLLEVGTCSTLAEPRVGAVSVASFQCREAPLRQVGRWVH